MEAFAKNVARLRRALGLTQEELAERLSVSPQAVSKWENNQSLPDLSLIAALAGQLGVSVDGLLGHVPSPRRSTAYEGRYEGEDYYWGSAPNELCYDVLRLRPPVRPLRLLDLGCGEGKDAVFFARCGYSVTAFDLSERGLDKARRRALAAGVEVDFFQADLLDVQPEGVFDVIFASGTLHYLGPERRREMMEHYQAHTASGGLHALNVLSPSLFSRRPRMRSLPPHCGVRGSWRSCTPTGAFTGWRRSYSTVTAAGCLISTAWTSWWRRSGYKKGPGHLRCPGPFSFRSY